MPHFLKLLNDFIITDIFGLILESYENKKDVQSKKKSIESSQITVYKR